MTSLKEKNELTSLSSLCNRPPILVQASMHLVESFEMLFQVCRKWYSPFSLHATFTVCIRPHSPNRQFK